MKNLVSICALIIIIPIAGYGQQEFLNTIFQEANNYYINQQYAEAVNAYNQILQQGYEHPDLYYNLGNSYYRLDRLGDAIWAFEMGKQMSPRDEDLLFNLKVANARIADRVDIPEGFFIIDWYNALKRGFSPLQWLLFISVVFLSSGFLYSISYFMKTVFHRFVKKIVVIGLIITGVALLIYADLHFEGTKIKEGVIVVEEGKVFSSPTELGNVVFVVHEGTKTMIVEDQFSWVEIELIDGKKGWIKSDQLRRL